MGLERGWGEAGSRGERREEAEGMERQGSVGCGLEEKTKSERVWQEGEKTDLQYLTWTCVHAQVRVEKDSQKGNNFYIHDAL